MAKMRVHELGSGFGVGCETCFFSVCGASGFAKCLFTFSISLSRPYNGERRPQGQSSFNGERRPQGDRPFNGERRPQGDRPFNGERRPQGQGSFNGERRPQGQGSFNGERRPQGLNELWPCGLLSPLYGLSPCGLCPPWVRAHSMVKEGHRVKAHLTKTGDRKDKAKDQLLNAAALCSFVSSFARSDLIELFSPLL